MRNRNRQPQPRSTSHGSSGGSTAGHSLALAAAIIAACLIWVNTGNVWVTVAAIIIVMALVSGQMFGILIGLLTVLVREGARVLIAYKRYTAIMYQENQRTERERLKWQARVAVESQRQDTYLVRSSVAHSQQRVKMAGRLAASQPVEMPFEIDELADIDYTVEE